jgi:hypothetical protein
MDMSIAVGGDRAAMLVHQRFAARAGGSGADPTPWAELSEFCRESYRRQVRTALHSVEQIAGHTWETGTAGPPDPRACTAEPLAVLRSLGFDGTAAVAMARAEHEDRCRFYSEAGWRYAPVRDEDRKVDDKLMDWDVIEQHPDSLAAALTGLAMTLLALAELGWRSTPGWRRYRRTGIVTARQRGQAWTWTSRSGDTMHAEPGDWAVHDEEGNSWSVRDDIFRETYQHAGEDRWRRMGFVLARPARGAETIETLEGPAGAAEGDWIVRGENGEQWPVPAGQFAQRYQGPIGP